MNILLQDVVVQTYLFDFRLPYSLLSVTSAQQLLGYTNIPTNLDLMVTVCVDSQHSFSTKLPFRSVLNFGTHVREWGTSFAASFSPVSSTPFINIPGGVNRLFTHPQRGAEDVLESLPGRFALPPGSTYGSLSAYNPRRMNIVGYMLNFTDFQSPTSQFCREVDRLCGEHNTAANVDLSVESSLVLAVLRARHQAMCTSTYQLTFLRFSAPSYSLFMNTVIWGYKNSDNSTPFRPLLSGYLTCKYDRVLNVGCGLNSYAVYVMGWSTNSCFGFNNVFRFQRDSLASVIPEDIVNVDHIAGTYSFIEDRWCNAATGTAWSVKASNVWKDFQGETCDACQSMSIRTGNVLWMDARRAGRLLTTESSLQQNMLISIKAELREIVIGYYLTGIYEHLMKSILSNSSNFYLRRTCSL
ncbi:hypothetical protein C8R42DRAFT_724509 [Lentinula raphanica]|nr:hypothetical protein C8R42DRAFT_724509 [Lentinula raphanica]